MCSDECKHSAIAVIGILISVFNLAEQITVYFLQKELDLNDDAQRRFFFILFGITGFSITKAFFSGERNKAIISLIIEIGEFICYSAFFGASDRLIAAATIFLLLELILHIINIILLDNEKGMGLPEKILQFSKLFFGTVLHQIGPMLTIFLRSDSRFRDTLFEVSLIFSLFFSAAIWEQMRLAYSTCLMQLKKTQVASIDFISEAVDFDIVSKFIGDPETNINNKHKIERVWLGISYCCAASINLLYIPLLMIVLASLELQYSHMIPSYDHGLYIYLIISGASALVILPCTFCGVCFLVPSIMNS